MQFIDLKKQQDRIRKDIEKRILRVLNHGKYIMGPEVFELEEKLAGYTGSRHCVSCSSGTDALLMPLMAWDIGPGDAVFTTPFTFIATAEVIQLLGATPVFVDIDRETFNIDPELLEQAILDVKNEGNLTPKVIIPVDLFGLPANYQEISKIANTHGLLVLEDGAQGFGGSIGGRKACSFGDAASTSFFPAKPLGGYGDGGAIFTDDESLYKELVSIRVHGKGKDKYDNVRIGINGRLDTLQAAIVLSKLSLFDEEIQLRNIIAESYTSILGNKFTVQKVHAQYESAWAQYSILANSAKDRESRMADLKKAGIPSAIYYPLPLHLQGAFTSLGYSNGCFPVSEEISHKIFSLPMHPYITEEDILLITRILTG